MKLIFGLVLWFAQLIYLIFVAVFKTITHLLFAVFSTSQQHLSRNVERGKTFVRAYFFLEILEAGLGDTAEDANKMASTLLSSVSDPDLDAQIIRSAAAYAKQHHGGKQLPVIAEARAKGFIGLGG